MCLIFMFQLVILVQLFNYGKCFKRSLFNSSVSTLTTALEYYKLHVICIFMCLCDCSNCLVLKSYVLKTVP